ncbi:hypothetical protein [Pyrobaculum ferrireducens]|uniref:Uncharacterized protein n=1 Tax=Pyrobaculum ferrireducens TaxID=1104324 RepID=G7VEZ9_9CREN|nr:hypothetical protein [Pyrobaculum ferrireducens]AET34164.1 hypothetical protein P186_2788 [Pyrobaculum ferrireducens]
MPRTPGRLCCEKLREAAAVDKAAVAVEKSANMQKAGGGGAAERREAAERPGTPPVDNVWVAILRRRLSSSAADENAG